VDSIQIIVLVTLPLLMVTAAVYDLLTMTIPNRISLALIAAFIVCALLLGVGWLALAYHFGAALLVLAVGLGLFAAGWVGGGDVKLVAATTLWLGFGHLLEYLMAAALAGGVLTLMILVLRRVPLPDAALRMTWLSRLHTPTNGVPYGVALAVGALIVFPRSALWVAAFPG